MEPSEFGRLAVAIERQYRQTLHAVVAEATPDPDEQIHIASAVVALLLRRMYHQRGQAWLELILQMVLQPDATIEGRAS